jgi:hypothetical protein
MIELATSPTLPRIGDPRKTYPVTLTEPEINAIHAVAAFCEQATKVNIPIVRAWWEHYGPTFGALSVRLAIYDDSDKPFEGLS